MTRVVLLLLPATVFITSLVITILPPAAADCGCAPYRTCSDCDGGKMTGPCCNAYGACGYGGGYCEPCYCDLDRCDDCFCFGTCASHNIRVTNYDDHHRNHNSSSRNVNNNVSTAAAPAPSWHLMENISSSSSVTSPSPSNA
ncbi:unnamed protein product [Linum trigynum]|uniref:Chitin-binding type-1 domain-containing protein n=1 Tax=Linum trigynum TaxID=586398 RepID=A0AAV2GTJ0_9ROSI